MPTVLITGASQGIGLEFVRQYRAEHWDVAATVRDSAGEARVKETGAEAFNLDVRDFKAVQDFVKSWGSRPIDVLIANAGTYGDDLRFDSQSMEDWLNVIQTNTIAPVMLALGLSDCIARSREKKLVAITSLMGSIADNTSGAHIPYRTSKAALNMAWKTLAIDLAPRGVLTAVLHPGWVKTRMGGDNALIEARDSVTNMRSVIASLAKKDTGAFMRYNGARLPW